MAQSNGSQPASRGREADDFENAEESLRPENVARHPRLREAARLLRQRRFGIAKAMLAGFLNDHPGNVRAMHLLACVAADRGEVYEAQTLLEQCVQTASDFIPSRYLLANVLMTLTQHGAALGQAEELVRREPKNPLFRRLMAIILEKTGNHAAAAGVWRGLIDDYPGKPESWERYGNALRALGMFEDAVEAYRKLIELDPHAGIAWWLLADVKTLRFDQADVDQMENELATEGLEAHARTYLHFALGKAYGGLKLYEKSFGHYAKGNAIRRMGVTHDPGVQDAYVSRCRSVFSVDFFRERVGFGCASAAPIFVVGMLRSGSTLVEQILASHSAIEGTQELTELAAISRQLQNAAGARDAYPGILGDLDAPALKKLGEDYLEAACVHRKFGRPFFTDKMGANYAHTGLIQLILPNARIIDVRRHPMACCFSNFVQIFPEGQDNAYRLADIGHHYRNYVELMAHFDQALPGRVHRLFYEDLIRNPEAEIRRLLAFLELPFEQDCLLFYNTERAVTTVSAEQVRQPIYRGALEQWKHYEPWLGPLKVALGPIVDAYPAVPAFD